MADSDTPNPGDLREQLSDGVASEPHAKTSESWARAAAEAILDAAGVETLGFPSGCDEADEQSKGPRE